MSNIVGNYFRLGPLTETRALARGPGALQLARCSRVQAEGNGAFGVVATPSTPLRRPVVVRAPAELLARVGAVVGGSVVMPALVFVPLVADRVLRFTGGGR